jgi:hypothetical protein
MKGYKSLENTKDFVKGQAKLLRKALKVFRKTCSKKTFQACVSPTFLKLSNMDDSIWESYIACENQISRSLGNHLGANYMYSTMMLHSLDLNAESLSNVDGQEIWKGSAPLLRKALHTAIWDREKIAIGNPSNYLKSIEESVGLKVRFGNGMDESEKEDLLKVIEIAEEQCSLSQMIKGVEPATSDLTGESRAYMPLEYESAAKNEEIIGCIEGNFDRKSLEQYFYTTDRVVIYPESADLLTSIFEADYHLDGFELDSSLKDFILMMPEGFEINGVDVPSIQVSISSRCQRNVAMYAYVKDVLENRCRDQGAALLYQHIIEEYEHGLINAENALEISKKHLGIHESSMEVWTEESIEKFKHEIEQTGQSLDEAIDGLALQEFFLTQIVIRGGGAYATLGMESFFNAVNADKDPESEKEFLENNYSNDVHQNQESADRLADICKLICSVLVYCQALGDEVLHKGVPFKKDNVIKLPKNANKKKGTTSMTLRGPKGFSSKRAQSHYRKWHFRTLKDERFYQSDEWKDKPRGSRVVFVRDSVVNRDVSPHVLTDGTNVEDKVMTAEMSKEANNG